MSIDLIRPTRIHDEKSHYTVSHNKSKQLLPYVNIVRIKAARAYCVFHMLNGDQPVCSKYIGKVLDELTSEMFYQPHKSDVINFWHVQSTILRKRDGHILMADGELVKLSCRNRFDFPGKYEKFCLKYAIERAG